MAVEVYPINAGYFKLDGGAMFGVVPKTMWQKFNAPDENNMCTWALRCLLVVDGNRKILIDTGIGNKQDDKFISHFHPSTDIDLISSLKEKWINAEDITDVLLTHFHFDHVGGALKIEKNKVIPTFPNAKYWSNEYHYQWALNPNEREKASFLKENFVPLKDQGILHFIDVEQDIQFSDSISLHFVYGHTGGMMIPTIHLSDSRSLIYCADLLPSNGHIGLPYVMAYDVQPLVTINEKNELFDRAINTNSYLFLEHDKDMACIEIERNEKGKVVMKREIDPGEIYS